MYLIEKCFSGTLLSNVRHGFFHHDLGVIRHVVRTLSVGPASKAEDADHLDGDASPQGIQGDDCVNFKMWQENCRRYGFTNCNEQLQGIQSGKKTLAEVFAEQEKLIAEIAETYRASTSASRQVDQQGVQEDFTTFPTLDSPCPQGIQGDDCIRYKLWLENCHRFGVQDCMQNYASFKTGRKTLAQVFAEQDQIIRDVVNTVKMQRRNYSTSTPGTERQHKPQSVGVPVTPQRKTTPSSQPGSVKTEVEEASTATEPQLSQKDRLKRAVKEYGSTVIVFHVTISLASLGFFYLLVSSGLDVAGFLLKLDIGGEILKSKLAAGTGTFVLAYAVHKVFAPVRIATTLTATPFIVRYLRQVGFLKVPKQAKKDAGDLPKI